MGRCGLIIRATYEGPSEQIGQNLMKALAQDAVWIEADGFPYAGSYIGPEAIVQGVFLRIASEWIGYRAEVKSYVVEGDQVVALGTYHGIYKITGKTMQADCPLTSSATWCSGPPHRRA